MEKIWTPEHMREAEQAAMAAGTPGIDLMERAAEHVARRVWEMAQGREALFVCGGGNNGGDGLAAARLYAQRGGRALVALVGASSQTQDAAVNLQRLAATGVPMVELSTVSCLPLIVDALFGTGLHRAPEGPHAEAIEWINRCGAPVLSVDLPSGVDARDGSTPGVAVRATETVTFQTRKPGHLLFPGRGLCGAVDVGDIGLRDEPRAEDFACLERSDVARLLPPRARDAHKGHFGRVLLVAGSRGMAGAAALCARGALCAGAGLVTVATTQDVLPVVQTLAPEAMAALLPEENGTVRTGCGDALPPLLRGKTVAAVGPGMTAGEGTREAVAACLGSALPTVVDADGLNALCGHLHLLRGAQAILTPHPGEMERLLDGPVGEPVAAARKLAAATGAVVLLKGASTVIAAPDGRTTLNQTGTPTMARGGSGDVLTGIIAALLAQGLTLYDAARLGAFLHGLAGEAAERSHGLASTAMRLPEALGPVFLEAYKRIDE